MRFRTLALALALSCGVTAMAQPKHKTVVSRKASGGSKRARKALAKRVKPRKAKRVVRHKSV